jgi:hypothetical protein
MPWNVKKSASRTGVEVMKYPTGLHAIASVVLDGTDFAVTTDGTRYEVPAGTILTRSVTNTDKYVEYKGSGKVEGILRYPVDMLVQATEGSEPAAMLFFGAAFATGAIHNFTLYASALVHDLNHCTFE